MLDKNKRWKTQIWFLLTISKFSWPSITKLFTGFPRFENSNYCLDLFLSIYIGVFFSNSTYTICIILIKRYIYFLWQEFTTAVTLSTDSFSGILVPWIRILVRWLYCSLLSLVISNRSNILFSKAICPLSSLIQFVCFFSFS